MEVGDYYLDLVVIVNFQEVLSILFHDNLLKSRCHRMVNAGKVRRNKQPVVIFLPAQSFAKLLRVFSLHLACDIACSFTCQFLVVTF